ncbi:MAG TPA: hypothetical protein P5080_05405 [Candidatus Paceibacterota bacterium]|nr:hypothetical protein [Candidatus Paceibacterota bacterium]HSA37106.1 hypothetical protein [Candidatus Paceibacterota bacterium]
MEDTENKTPVARVIRCNIEEAILQVYTPMKFRSVESIATRNAQMAQERCRYYAGMLARTVRTKPKQKRMDTALMPDQRSNFLTESIEV